MANQQNKWILPNVQRLQTVSSTHQQIKAFLWDLPPSIFFPFAKDKFLI